jgi:hypothetical protein
MSVARLRLAPAGETVFPPRAPFSEGTDGNLPVPVANPPRAHAPEAGA